jgi:hypothetical protein
MVHIFDIPVQIVGEYDFNRQVFQVQIPGIIAGSRTQAYFSIGRVRLDESGDPVASPLLHMLHVPEEKGQQWLHENKESLRAEIIAKYANSWFGKERVTGEFVAADILSVKAWRIYNSNTGSIVASTPESQHANVSLPVYGRWNARDARARIHFEAFPADATLFMGGREGISYHVSKEEMGNRNAMLPGFYAFQIHDGKRMHHPFYAELDGGDVLDIAFSKNPEEEPTVTLRNTRGGVVSITKGILRSGECGAVKVVGGPDGSIPVIAGWNGFETLASDPIDATRVVPGIRDVGIRRTKDGRVFSRRVVIGKSEFVQVDFRGRFSNSANVETSSLDATTTKAMLPEVEPIMGTKTAPSAGEIAKADRRSVNVSSRSDKVNSSPAGERPSESPGLLRISAKDLPARLSGGSCPSRDEFALRKCFKALVAHRESLTKEPMVITDVPVDVSPKYDFKKKGYTITVGCWLADDGRNVSRNDFNKGAQTFITSGRPTGFTRNGDISCRPWRTFPHVPEAEAESWSQKHLERIHGEMTAKLEEWDISSRDWGDAQGYSTRILELKILGAGGEVIYGRDAASPPAIKRTPQPDPDGR